jgi:hypothetical protein
MPHLLPKIKAPFRLTMMNHLSQRPWIWLWSRCGSYWIVNQVLPVNLPRKSAQKGV